MKPKTIWLLVADGQRAQIYRYFGATRQAEAEADLAFARDGAPSRAIRTDKAGRMQPSAGSGGAAFSPRADAHDQEEERFLDKVATSVNAAIDAGRCDEIILAAPPRALGHLRRVIPPMMLKRIKAEIDKDFTKTEIAKLGALVAEHLQG
ncbi:host attachment protein [Dongia sp.]|uniref:host attachment protein n=1 Tax=Dongia sp. TaxID=1977262 RepID=UPI0035B0A142